jgi:hypothetical protein
MLDAVPFNVVMRVDGLLACQRQIASSDASLGRQVHTHCAFSTGSQKECEALLLWLGCILIIRF